MTDINEPRRTRPQNANKHPGLPDLEGQSQRRSQAKKKNTKLPQETREAQELAAVEGLQRLSAMQEEMKKAEVQSMTKKPKAVRPRARPVKKKSEPAAQADKALLGVGTDTVASECMSQMLRDTEPGEDVEARSRENQKDDGIKTKKKTEKDTALAAQSGARVEDKKGKLMCVQTSFPTMMLMLTESTLLFLNLTSNFRTKSKFSLGRRIQGWVKDVSPDQSDIVSSAPKPPHTAVTGLTLVHEPSTTVFLSGSHPTSATIVTTSSGQHKIPPQVVANSSQALVGGFGDELFDSEDRSDILPKPSALKIIDVPTELTADGSLPMEGLKDDTKDSDDASTDADNDAPTDADNDATMDVEEDMADKSQDSGDSLSSFIFRRSKNRAHNAVDTKRRVPVFKDSSDEDDDIEVLNMDHSMTKPTGFVETTKTAKKAVRLTSSTSVGISKSSTTMQPPAKKVKTEDGADDTIPKSTLTALPGYWIEKRYKSRSAYRNCDLPPQCQDQRWPKHFLPTVYLWAGSQNDLWQISDNSLVDALQCIMDVVYDDSDLQYKVNTQGSVFGVATQRLAEWRSNFGSTGLAIMIDFYARNKDTDAKELGQALMEDFAFLFEDMDNIDTMQAFRSPFMLQLFATAHLHSIIGYAEVTALKTDVLASIGMADVLGICAASLERAIKCLSDGAINIDSDALDMCPAQRKRKLRTPRTFNKATGNHSTTEHAFSINNWGSVTTSYVTGVKKKGESFLRETTSMARKLLKKSGNAALRKYISLNDEDEEENIDRRCMLW
ncbi:hypothetical protein C8R48DRAFT_768014 [Suillus tomentosus]|nr:hypothetical protein C8R48DRAFT_768014 [Suillus tomentosus]